jgi:myo-inositol 2-dehydrogenase/D-chiro-inositol 1-dehydrogenase
VRIGVVGLGRIGLYHARLVREQPRVSSIVVYDVDEQRAQVAQQELSCEMATTIGALLDGVDAVVIAASTSAHPELIHQAIDAGKTTFCEKPVALDLASTVEVVRHARESRVPVQIGFQRRFDVGYQRAREAVTSGALGTVYVTRMAAHDPAPPHEGYIPVSGGIFRDLHIHDFDIVRWVLGQEVVEVHADGAVLVHDVFRKYDDIDTSVALLTLSNGTRGILSGTRHDPLGYDIRMELFGSGDSIAIGWNARTPLRSVEPGMPAGPESPYRFFIDRFDAAYRAEIAAFLSLARGEIENPCPPAEGEAALRIAIACDRSRKERRTVRVDEVGE